MSDHLIATIKKNSREEIRVSLGELYGHQIFNARVWFEGADGSMRPSKAGISFKIERLSDFQQAVDAALSEAKKRGLV